MEYLNIRECIKVYKLDYNSPTSYDIHFKITYIKV